tara:strand:- start:2174 stop:2461 length:288 start_codon:yes stop_codon:yes gene_type:complete
VTSNKTGKLLASATNIGKPTSGVKNGFTVHAEVAVMSKLKSLIRDRKIDAKSLSKGVTVYSLRFNTKGELMGAKPCLNCQRTLCSFALVSRVLYS